MILNTCRNKLNVRITANRIEYEIRESSRIKVETTKPQQKCNVNHNVQERDGKGAERVQRRLRERERPRTKVRGYSARCAVAGRIRAQPRPGAKVRFLANKETHRLSLKRLRWKI